MRLCAPTCGYVRLAAREQNIYEGCPLFAGGDRNNAGVFPPLGEKKMGQLLRMPPMKISSSQATHVLVVFLRIEV